MTSHRTRGFAVLAIAIGLATVVAIGDGSRLSPPGGGASVPVGAANDLTARLHSDEPALRARLLAVTTRQPLLAALQNHLDRPALLGLLQSADWWRDIRSDFQMARVVLGTEAWATLGALDPGKQDRDVVAEARRVGFASAIASLNGRSCVLLAGRLPVLPDQAPVLVLARILDEPRSRAVSRSPLDFVLWAIALLMAAGAARLLARRRLATNGPNGALAEPTEPDSNPGPTTASKTSQRAQGRKASPPADVPSASAPLGHGRHPTAPDGTPIAADGSPGQRFGRYQLLNRVGEGGMAEVFTAVANGAEGFSRIFVLKRMRPELSRNQEAVAQFIDEARMQASLVHSNIVPVFDFGRVGSEYFMTQEYIVGRDLTRIVAGRYDHSQLPLDPRFAYYVAHETLQALQFAHNKRDKEGQPLGLVHRDVSPGNIIVSAQGEVKLADFGVVKSNRRATKTQVGMIKGNANFMSPEQARGHHVDARSDLFSVGLVLYYCLTNRFLYDGDNDLDVLYKAACGPVADFNQYLAELPSLAGDVLRRALAVEPGDRFQTAAEFADVLAPHVSGAKPEAAHLMQDLFGEELRREAA